MFEYIESELKDIDTDLLDRNACEYGRACKQAAYTLLAKLYLNAKIYTGNEHWTDCITYCKEVIKAVILLKMIMRSFSMLIMTNVPMKSFSHCR